MHRKSQIAILSNCRRQTAEDLGRYDPAAVLLFEPRALCVKCLISSVRPIALLLKQEEEKGESDLPTSPYYPRFTLANPM